MHDYLYYINLNSGLDFLAAAFMILHSKRWVHLHFWIAKPGAMFSTSVVDSETLNYFLLLQLTEAPMRINTSEV